MPVVVATAVAPAQAPLFFKNFPIGPNGRIDTSVAYPTGNAPGIPAWMHSGLPVETSRGLGSSYSACVVQHGPYRCLPVPGMSVAQSQDTGFGAVRGSRALALRGRLMPSRRAPLGDGLIERVVVTGSGGLPGTPSYVPMSGALGRFSGFGRAGGGGFGLPGTVASFMADVTAFTAVLSLILSTPGAQLAMDHVVPGSYEIVSGLDAAFRSAATTGKVPSWACVVMQTGPFLQLWDWLNGAGRSSAGILGDLADATAILATLCGNTHIVGVSKDIAAQTQAWAKARGFTSTIGNFPPGSVAVRDTTTNWYWVYAPTATASLHGAGFGDATAPTLPGMTLVGKSPPPPPPGVTVAGSSAGATASTGLPTWAKVAIGVGAAAAAGTIGWLAFK